VRPSDGPLARHVQLSTVAFNDECIVAERTDPPAAVICACEATMDTTCVADDTVAFDVSDAGGVASVAITNDFRVREGAPDAAAPPPSAVAAQPAFTG
jgi:hypothetical protein